MVFIKKPLKIQFTLPAEGIEDHSTQVEMSSEKFNYLIVRVSSNAIAWKGPLNAWFISQQRIQVLAGLHFAKGFLHRSVQL